MCFIISCICTHLGKCWRNISNCWSDRRCLEKCLIVIVVLLLVMLIITESTHNGKSKLKEPPKTCGTPTCLKEAAKILNSIDDNVNPCHNFYQFACNNYVKNAEKEDQMDLDDYRQQQLIDVYMEDINPRDHSMVKAAKGLFQACLDEVQIATDELKTIKSNLRIAGGWPILEGDEWNAADFDWLNATYKFRELGLFYSVFLKLSVTDHPKMADRHVLKVSTGHVNDKYIVNNDKLQLMTVAAGIFGAKDKKRVETEMKEAYEFWKNLVNHQYPFDVENSSLVHTPNAYQKQFTEINWLKFINTIAAPTVSFTGTEDVLFPPNVNMTAWLKFIETTPKRTQANYMMWRVIEETIPYLSRQLRFEKSSLRKRQTYEQFCLGVTEESFVPSPIRLIADNRYLPMKKRRLVEEMLKDLTVELIETLHELEWVDQDDREKTERILRSMKIIIERPVEESIEDVLNDMVVDLVPVNRITFLNLLAQARRNLISFRLKQVNKLRSESYLDKWREHAEEPNYNEKTNVFFIPGFTFQTFFNEKKPQYLNYGTVGTLIAHHFGGIIINIGATNWSNVTEENYKETKKCLHDRLRMGFDVLPPWVNDEMEERIIRGLIQKAIGQRTAYIAYHLWQDKNEKEFPLTATRYQPDQLYWIAAAMTYCPRQSEINPKIHRLKLTSDMVAITMTHDLNFIRAFKCPDHEINVFKKCNMF